MPSGMIMPPATPCSTRKAISDPSDQANPHSSDAATNVDPVAIQSRRKPNRSAAQPVSGITVASANR